MDENPFLSELSDIHILYGAPDELPLDTNIVQGPTLEESIENAKNFCLKMRDLGFPNEISDKATPSSLFSREYQAISRKRAKKEKEFFKQVTLKDMDDSTRALYTYQPVKDIIKELKSIPFYDQIKRYETVTGFQQRVIQCLNQMKVDKMIDTNTHKSPPIHVIHYYQTELERIRKEIIKKCFDKNLIDKSKCNQDQLKLQQDFPEHFQFQKKITSSPVKSDKKDISESLINVIDSVDVSQDLPPSYRPDPHALTEEEKNQFIDDCMK